MKNLIFLFVVLFASSSVYAEAGKMFFGVNGFYNMTDDDSVESSFGGEANFGINIQEPIFVEAYFAYAMYSTCDDFDDATGMHFGAKIGAIFEEMFVIKAGGGLARFSIDAPGPTPGASSITINNNEFEIVANAGVELPVESMFITILGNFSYVMADSAFMIYGVSAGVKFPF